MQFTDVDVACAILTGADPAYLATNGFRPACPASGFQVPES